VLFTAPVTQSLELIDQSELVFPVDLLGPLRIIQYNPCLVLIVKLQNELKLAEYGILKNPNSNLSGIFDQTAKGIKNTEPVLVIHAAPHLSMQLWEQESAEIITNLWTETLSVLESVNLKAESFCFDLHKWKYCEPKTVLPQPFFAQEIGEIRGAGNWIVFAGDCFGQSSVNGAYSSGEAAGDFISTLI
jgi:predicted NAD/FAD-dependent oxidoreductase